jgi:hypothetical protein
MQSRIAIGSHGERELDGRARQSLGLPARSAAAVSVALLREPGRRPAGLADRPFSHLRPRPTPAVLATAHQTWSSPLFDRRRI